MKNRMRKRKATLDFKISKFVEISLGKMVREDNLPYPVVIYPNHYGTFFAFSKDENSSPVLCFCTKPAVINYINLMKRVPRERNADKLREAILDSYYFPDVIAEKSLSAPDNPISILEFVDGLCHRCNLRTPSLRYCHEMYGGQFIQSYGWYVNLMYFHLGIISTSFQYLPDVCPEEYQQDIKSLIEIGEIAQKEEQRLMAIASGEKREDIADDEPT
ncbi:hypothetical protein [Paenibacillus sp. SI8]|uniref:hypothetical protein n=1 Tax=unclassified Paenibacillus TaxID=185978 RepID=UPI003466F914